MPEWITHQDAQYALDLVKRICDQVGPGKPGSRQEQARASLLKNELESHLGADNVHLEEFSHAPEAWLGSLPVTALLMLAAVLLNISTGRLVGVSHLVVAQAYAPVTAGAPTPATALLALAFSVAAVLPFLLEYFLYYEFVDLIFKKKPGVNLVGVLRKPGTQEVKRLLILSGHHDSALENTWIGSLGKGMYVTVPTIFLALFTLLAASALQVGGLAAGSGSLIRAGSLGWVLLAYPVVPAVVFALFFNRGRKNGGTVPGAADNLSACAVGAAMTRFLVNNPACMPADTEIRIISFGGEEAGLHGSRRYVERHLDELKRLDARLLNYEVVAHPEIAILTTDMRGVRHSPEMVNSVVAAAVRAQVPYKVKPIPAGGGGNDSGFFSLAGLKATTLLPFQVPQQLLAFYHQKWDCPDILTIEPLYNVLKLTLEWLRCGGE